MWLFARQQCPHSLVRARRWQSLRHWNLEGLTGLSDEAEQARKQAEAAQAEAVRMKQEAEKAAAVAALQKQEADQARAAALAQQQAELRLQ